MVSVNGLPIATVSGNPWPGIAYFCTQRQGGYSTGSRGGLNLALHVGDNPAHVAANRALLRTCLPDQPVWLEQVHGTAIYDADTMDAGDSTKLPRADAAITTTANRVLAILTADCLPVLIADCDGRAIGLAHAGWRGLAGGVLENTLQALQTRLPDARNWRAWIGPGISQAYFEVGADVFEAFVSADVACQAYFAKSSASGRWLADLAGLAIHRLRQVGVSSLQSSGWCTYHHTERFFSYRRHPVCGRMVTVAWRQASE